MFRFHKPLDIVTLFHKAQSPASTQIAKLLKEVSASGTAAANATDTNDQTQSKRLSRVFELDITETPPTADQLQTILDYVGNDQISHIIKGASTKKDALEKFRQNASSFTAPVVVDWHHGRAVAASTNSKILEMLEQAQADKE